MYWQPGDTVLQRYVGHADGILWGWPHIVLEDGPHRTVLFQPEGTMLHAWSMDEMRFTEPMTARMHALRFIYLEAPYHVTMWFDAGTGVPAWWQPHFGSVEGRFKGWKVDMSSPHRRTDIGFNTSDEILDYIVHPDGSWYMKDNEELDLFTARGVYTTEEAARIRQAARELRPAIEARLSPFDDEWRAWLPPEDLHLGPLPERWMEIPGAEIHLSTLNYEQNKPGRRYNEWRHSSKQF